jgi:hypothetical protein
VSAAQAVGRRHTFVAHSRALGLLVPWALGCAAPVRAEAQPVVGYGIESVVPSSPLPLPTATVFEAPADDGSATIALPFRVRLFDLSSDALRVGANGALSIDAGASISASNDALGDPDAPNRIVAAWWDDLELRRPAAIVGYRIDGAAPARSVTIVWSEVERYGATDGALSFAVTLHEGASGRVDVAYAPVDDQARSQPSWGATVGVEGAAGAPTTTWSPCSPSCGADALSALSGNTFRLVLQGPQTLTHAWRGAPLGVARGERRVLALSLDNGADRERTPSEIRVTLGDRVVARVAPGPTVAPRARAIWTVTATVPVDLPLGPSAWVATVTVPDDPDPLDDAVTAPTWVGPGGVNLALLEPTATLDGELLTVDVTVASLGARPAPDAVLWLVLGPDPVSTRADRRLAARVVSAASMPARVRLTATLPSDRGFADRLFGLVLDPEDVIAETDALDDSWTAPLVLPPPARSGALRTTRLPRAVVDEPYDVTLDLDAPDDATLTLASTPPAGLALEARRLSGVPTAAGISPLVFRVEGPDARAATSTLTLAVVRADVPLGLAQRVLPDATRGEAYFAPLFGVGDARGTLAWRLVGGALPAGLAIVDAAVVGTPLEHGTFSPTLELSDGQGRAEGALTLVVRPPLRAAIVARPLAPATIGRAYTDTIAIDPPDPTLRLALVDGDLPDGLTLEAPGVLRGTPRAARGGGRARFVVALIDADTLVLDRARLELTVVDPRPLALTIDPPVALPEGRSVLLRAEAPTLADGPFGLTVRTTPTPLPAGLVLTVEEQLGRVTLSGVAPRAGVEASVWIELVDDAGRVAMGVLAVAGVPDPPAADVGCQATGSSATALVSATGLAALAIAAAARRKRRPQAR